jgi:uncharacterized protein (TIGR00106 family)
MIAQFTLIPLGTKSGSLSKSLAKAMKHVADSGLNYKAGPMGTAVEGEWYQIMNLINRCRKTILREHPRVHIAIAIDDRIGARDQIKGKVKSLEIKMGMKLRK